VSRGQSKPVYTAARSSNSANSNNVEKRGKHQTYFKGQEGSAFDEFVYEQSMKWYQFLVYFGLWIIAASYFLGGAGTILSFVRMRVNLGGLSLSFSYVRNNLLYVGISLVTSIALGVYAIVVRKLLSRRSSKAIKALIGLFIADFAVVAINTVLIGATGMNLITNLVGAALGDGFMIWINGVYFKKRKDYFVY